MKNGRQLDLAFELPEDDPYALLDPAVAQAISDPIAEIEESQRRNLELALKKLTGLNISLILTDNASRLISAKKNGFFYVVRLHHMFLGADPKVAGELARFIVDGNKKSSMILDNFIKEHRDEIAPPPPRKQRISTKGEFHDLQEMFDYINSHYFKNTIEAKITWGNVVRRRKRQKMQMGSYNASQKMIRIHPALDQYFVPSYYVSFVIYHEMLHAHFGVDSRSAITGRRIIHPAKLEFAEKEFADYEKAHAWEEKNIARLMRY